MTAADLVPLRGNVLVRPDPTVMETASGFLIPETAHMPPPMSGTVVRVSDFDYRLLRARVATVAHTLRLLDAAGTVDEAREEIGRYMRGLAGEANIDAIKVGDRVVFPMESGHQLVLGEDLDGSVLVMPQEAILATVPFDTDVVVAPV